jgi:hypothetical protein
MELWSREGRRMEAASRGRYGQRAALLALITSVGLTTGCSSQKVVGRPSSQAESLRPETDRVMKHATVATDPNTVPPGQTIPPAGLGVDL